MNNLMYGYTDICILFRLQYLASISNASPMPLDPPAGFNEPQPSESAPNQSVDIDPDNAVLVQSKIKKFRSIYQSRVLMLDASFMPKENS